MIDFIHVFLKYIPSSKQVVFCGKDMHYGYVFTSEAIHTSTKNIAVIQADRQSLAIHLSDAHVAVPLMCSLDASTIRAAPNLELIIQYGVGVEAVDIPTATECGVIVSNISSSSTANAASCAEHAMYLIFASLRNITAMACSIHTRKLGVPLGQTLLGKNVLILGYGGIVDELIHRLTPFGVDFCVVKRTAWDAKSIKRLGRSGGEIYGYNDNSNDDTNNKATKTKARSKCTGYGVWPTDIPTCAPTADIIVIAINQDQHNKGCINYTSFFQHCKPGVAIINIARGGLIDYASLRRALDDNIIGFAALDVQWEEPVDPGDPVAQDPRVYLTPHIAGVTEKSYRDMAEVVARQVGRIQKRELPEVCLNMPEKPRVLLLGE